MVTEMLDLPVRDEVSTISTSKAGSGKFPSSLTTRGPRQLTAKRGLLCVDPEPHGGGGVPRVDVLTGGDFGQVGLEGTRVVDVRGDADAHCASGSNTNA